MIIIITTLAVVALLALIIGWLSARSITEPIKEMADFTRRMKQAQSLVEKIKIVEDLSNHKSYLSVNKQYTQMQEAKALLKRRHQRLLNAANNNDNDLGAGNEASSSVAQVNNNNNEADAHKLAIRRNIAQDRLL